MSIRMCSRRNIQRSFTHIHCEHTPILHKTHGPFVQPSSALCSLPQLTFHICTFLCLVLSIDAPQPPFHCQRKSRPSVLEASFRFVFPRLFECLPFVPCYPFLSSPHQSHIPNSPFQTNTNDQWQSEGSFPSSSPS